MMKVDLKGFRSSPTMFGILFVFTLAILLGQSEAGVRPRPYIYNNLIAQIDELYFKFVWIFKILEEAQRKALSIFP